ncbi:MAG: hypothetical protein EHM68_16170 [Lysobacterales bacterium]|nr:MAG: hypothetical protein EHM68_16170 [Xanthomonadales bacterium]
MRKQITGGLLALSLSFLTSPVFAGTVQVCEDIKNDPDYKGLYGLCNAYWNETDPDARADILAAFEEKAGPDGPSMPGLVVASCPCWDEAHLARASVNGTPNYCQITGTNTGPEQAVYGQDDYAAAYTFIVEDGLCIRGDPIGSGSGEIAWGFSEDAEATCRAGIGELVDLDFGGSCDQYLP